MGGSKEGTPDESGNILISETSSALTTNTGTTEKKPLR